MIETNTCFDLEIAPEMAGMRADRAIAALLPEYSRATIQNWLKQGNIQLGEKRIKPSDRLRGGENIQVVIPPLQPADWEAQNIPLDLVYEDTHIFVLNKPSGLVVHPGAGNPDHTLLNALLYIDPSLRGLPRAGIVHRLDKDTTGLMVVARTEQARQSLIEQLKGRKMRRHYLAVINGVPVSGETIDQPIGRHRFDRLRMAVTERGRPAVTHVRIKQKFRCHTLIEAMLDSGRTHQIRVHLAWRGFPLVGDPLYSGHTKLPPAAHDSVVSCLQGFERQALHAWYLSLIHPSSGETLSWKQDMPEDMIKLIDTLIADLKTSGDHS